MAISASRSVMARIPARSACSCPLWGVGSGAELPTDFQFTGQRIQSTIALYDYHARFYDPYVGRFIQADSIVPSPGNPQHFNRYSYVLNNPLAFTDPSGHYECGPACEGESLYGLTETIDNFPGVPPHIIQQVIESKQFSHLADLPLYEWQTYRRGELWAAGLHEAYQQGYLSKSDCDYLTLYGAVPVIMSDPDTQLIAAAQGFQFASWGWYMNSNTLGLFETTWGYSPEYWPADIEGYPSFNLDGNGDSIALPFSDSALRQQTGAVIESMDVTGHPPAGVRQGGSVDANGNWVQGLFQNRPDSTTGSRPLPARPLGYYTETDVWPGPGPRGAERLVFGTNGEVYYTNDHYRSFVQIR
jgi:RHS repeat-associated protein